MFHKIRNLLLGAGLLTLAVGSTNAAPLKILVVNQCGAFVHTNAINWLSSYLTTVVGPARGWSVTAPTSASATNLKFTTDSLATYNVIIWNNNTSIGGVITGATQRAAYERWCRNGGGTVAWHGFLDHGDLWGFVTDSLLGGTKFTVHSNWGSDRSAKVRWDTIPMSGETTPRSMKPEYDSLRRGFPTGQFTYPDEWYSFRSNPRLATASATWGNYPRAVDVLMNIAENTYTVPSGGAMGGDHPVAWSYKLPRATATCINSGNDSAGKCQGRFIFNARGHETDAFSGTGANAAPQDTAVTQKTRNWIYQSIIWAANIQSGTTSIKASDASFNGILETSKMNGLLRVNVSTSGNHVVNIFTLNGRNVERRAGIGAAEYTFSNLKTSSIYLVQVRSGKEVATRRVAL